MRVAVVGGTRFIGPFMVKGLVEQGHEVTVYHRGKTQAELPEGVSHVIVDREVPGQLAMALDINRPDAVIDMCGYHTKHLADIIATRIPLKHYVFCSTTAVYGQIFKDTPSELSVVNPKSDYEIHKIACENLLQQAHLLNIFPVTILRLAHPYGPLDELIYTTGRESLFLDRMRHGRPIIIPSAGDMRIHPIYVTDAADAFVFVLGRSECMGRTYNLASDEILSHNEYHESIARVLGVPLVAVNILGSWFEDKAYLWEGEKRNLAFAASWYKYESGFDVSALRSTGFRCLVDHDTGVAKTVEWLDKNNMIPASSDDDIEDRVIRVWKAG